MSYEQYCIDLLTKLVSIPSESQNEEAIAVYLDKVLKQIGMNTQIQHIEGKSYNIVGEIGKGIGEKKIILGGHIDTVCRNAFWETDPYETIERDDKIYGLGTCDMKAGLAAQITVIKKMIDEAKLQDGKIIFIGLADEERHSIGVQRFLKDNAGAEFAVFGEPHFKEIVVGATGKIFLKLVLRGKTGHAATPESGINAIDCMNRFLNAVSDKYYKLYEQRQTASLCVLKIESKYNGYSLNIPEECTAYMNKQLFVNEDAGSFIKDLEEIHARLDLGSFLNITREIPYYPPYSVNKDNRYVKKLLDVLETEFKFLPELIINQGVSDGNIMFNNGGINTILFGPEGKNLHKENEFVVKSSIFSYMYMLEKFLIDFFR